MTIHAKKAGEYHDHAFGRVYTLGQGENEMAGKVARRLLESYPKDLSADAGEVDQAKQEEESEAKAELSPDDQDLADALEE